MGQAIVLESTSYPGTTKDILVDQLKKDFSIGEEIYVAFHPKELIQDLMKIQFQRYQKL